MRKMLISFLDNQSNQRVCNSLHYLLVNIFIRFGAKLYRRIVGIHMGTNFAAFVADLFLYCFKKTSFSFCKNQANVIVAFTFTSRYLDGLLNIDNHYFEQIESPIKGDLAIRRIFSLVDMITKPKFSNCPNIFKIGLFW